MTAVIIAPHAAALRGGEGTRDLRQTLPATRCHRGAAHSEHAGCGRYRTIFDYQEYGSRIVASIRGGTGAKLLACVIACGPTRVVPLRFNSSSPLGWWSSMLRTEPSKQARRCFTNRFQVLRFATAFHEQKRSVGGSACPNPGGANPHQDRAS